MKAHCLFVTLDLTLIFLQYAFCLRLSASPQFIFSFFCKARIYAGNWKPRQQIPKEIQWVLKKHLKLFILFSLIFLFQASSHCTSEKWKQLFIFFSLSLYLLDSRCYLWHHKGQWYSTRDNTSDPSVCSALCDHLATPLFWSPARHVKDQCWQRWHIKPEGCKQRATFAAFWRSYLYSAGFIFIFCLKHFFVFCHWFYSAPLCTRWNQRHQLFAFGCPAWNAWIWFWN